MAESLFNNVSGIETTTSLRKRLRHRCFPKIFAKFLRTHFFIEHFKMAASESRKVRLFFL